MKAFMGVSNCELLVPRVQNLSVLSVVPVEASDMDNHNKKRPHRWQRLKEAVHVLGMAPGRSAATNSGSREGLKEQ